MSFASFPQKPITRQRALLYLVLTAILWSMGGLLIKWVTLPALAVAGGRSAIAALLMIAVIRKPRFDWSAAQIGGAVCYAATVILFVAANKLTTAANAILLQYTAPIWVALFGAWFLGERSTWRDWLTIAAVLAGMALFFLDGQSLTLGGSLGNLCSILSGVTFAGLALFLRKQKEADPLASVLLGNILTACIGLPFFLGASPTLLNWAGLLLLGLFQLGLSYLLYTSAIKHATALEAILIPVLEPILNPIWVFLLLREKPGPWALAGGAIVIIALTAWSALANLKRRKQADDEAAGRLGHCSKHTSETCRSI